VPCVSSGNYEKVRTPISAIVEYDREFFELLPRLYPHSDGRGRWRANFLLNIGWGDRDRLRPRLPRLAFNEVARWG
jgi:hypothetical protein